MSIHRHDVWQGSLVLLTILLALAAGLCLFDQAADHDDGMALDLCLLMVFVVSIAPVLLARLLLVGRADTELEIALLVVPVRAVDPPPKRVRHF